MDKPYRRYEILLPLRLNDGTQVAGELIADTLLELRERFGAVSCETQSIQGQWQHQGQIYQDNLMRLFVDVPDTSEHREFFVQFKEQLKTRFEQLEIWITTYPLDVI